jgi:hypothetical protein
MKKLVLALCLYLSSTAAFACAVYNTTSFVPGPTYQCQLFGMYTLAYRDVTVVTIATAGEYSVTVGTNNYHLPLVRFPRGGARVLSYHATISSVQIFDINRTLLAGFVASASTPTPYDGVNYSETLTVHLEPGDYQLEVQGAVNGGVIGPLAHRGIITLHVDGPH